MTSCFVRSETAAPDLTPSCSGNVMRSASYRRACLGFSKRSGASMSARMVQAQRKKTERNEHVVPHPQGLKNAHRTDLQTSPIWINYRPRGVKESCCRALKKSLHGSDLSRFFHPSKLATRQIGYSSPFSSDQFNGRETFIPDRARGAELAAPFVALCCAQHKAMNCCINPRAAPPPPRRYARRKPRQSPLSSRSPSGWTQETPQRTISTSTTATPHF